MDPELKYCVKSHGRTVLAAGIFLVAVALLLWLTRGHPERTIEMGFRTMAEVDGGMTARALFMFGPIASLLFGYAGSLLFLYEGTHDTQSLVLWGRRAGEKVTYPRVMFFIVVALAAPLGAAILLSNVYWDLPAGAVWLACFCTILYVSGIATAVACATGNWIAGLIAVVGLAAYFGVTASGTPQMSYPLKDLADPYYLLHHPNLISGGLFNYGREGPMYLVNQVWNLVVGALLLLGSSYYATRNLRRFL